MSCLFKRYCLYKRIVTFFVTFLCFCIGGWYRWRWALCSIYSIDVDSWQQPQVNRDKTRLNYHRNIMWISLVF